MRVDLRKVTVYILCAATCSLSWGQEGNGAGWKADGIIGKTEYKYVVELKPGEFFFYYFIDSLYIYAAVKVKSKGWVGLGIDPEVAMKGADMIIAYDEGSKVKIIDAYSRGIYGPHKADTDFGGREDLIVSAGKRDSLYVVVEFKRLLDTRDPFDRPVAEGKKVKIIFASARDSNLKRKHDVFKGSTTIQIGR